MSGRRVEVRRESLPVKGVFRISRGARREAEVVVCALHENGQVGRGECVPYARYGETVEQVVTALEQAAPAVAGGLDRRGLQSAMPPGAARNALDCAMWDLEAKRTGVPAWRLTGLAEAPRPITTAFTISVAPAAAMAEAARRNPDKPILKLKMASGAEDLERVRAVNAAAPQARLIVDANEAWTPGELESLAPELATLGVVLIEQPLPAGADSALASIPRPVPVCADESCHDRRDLPRLASLYDCVNIKLDKAGGLTEALLLLREAREAGLGIMVGCMVASSLAMAPAVLLAQQADFVDLDGPLLLAADRPSGLRYDGAILHPPDPALWG